MNKNASSKTSSKPTKETNHRELPLKTAPQGTLDPPSAWRNASRKVAPGNHEMLKISTTTETSTTKSLSPKHVDGIHRGGYVPQRYRRKKGWIRRWLEIFGIGLDHIILEDSLAEEVVNGLELTPSDLRKMMTAFDLIDVGGNGYFDYHVRNY